MQLRAFCKSKIHRATVTGAELEYIGSVAIDGDLLEKTDIRPGEKVCVWNLNNGERIETYAIHAPPHSGAIVLNGAAARKFHAGDKVIIATFVLTDEPVETRMAFGEYANRFVPFLDDNRAPASIEHFLKPADEVPEFLIASASFLPSVRAEISAASKASAFPPVATLKPPTAITPR